MHKKDQCYAKFPISEQVTELLQYKGEYVALGKKVLILIFFWKVVLFLVLNTDASQMDKLQEENAKLNEKAAALGKQVDLFLAHFAVFTAQMADLKEVVRRVKEAEKKKGGEGKVTKIPR